MRVKPAFQTASVAAQAISGKANAAPSLAYAHRIAAAKADGNKLEIAAGRQGYFVFVMVVTLLIAPRCVCTLVKVFV